MTRRHLAKRSKQALKCGVCVAMPSKHTSYAQVVMAYDCPVHTRGLGWQCATPDAPVLVRYLISIFRLK